jgi:hypothetical protein
MLRFLCCVLLFSLGVPAFGQNNSINLALPGAPGSYQSDSFRAEGLDCSMAIGSATNVEFGVIGVINRAPNTITTDLNMQQRDVGVYGRITIPIGAPRTRLDCNELYQLELKKKRMEVQKLERELQNLRALKFENMVNSK